MVKALLELPDQAVTVVAPPPRLLSRHNCAHVGMTEGEFSAALTRARAAGVRVARDGKLLLVETETFVAWLLRERAAQAGPANDSGPSPPPAPAPAGALTEADLDQEFRLEPVAPQAKPPRKGKR